MINKGKIKLKSKYRKKYFFENNIKNRILFSILSLIIAIFILIATAFNIIINRYIENDAINQINKALGIIQKVDDYQIPKDNIREKLDDLDNKNNDVSWFDFLRDIQRKVRMAQENSEAEAIIVDSDYNMIFPNTNYYMQNIEYLEKICEVMKRNDIKLGNQTVQKISTKYGVQYVASININKTVNTNIDSDKYIVLSVEISDSLRLINTINIFLLLIMLVIGLCAIFVSRKISDNIASPIDELSEFAENIGRGDFKNREFNFDDMELQELADIMNKSATYLEKDSREKTVFFQNVSHELRTPLMSINGYAEAIKYKIMDPYEAVEIIIKESENLKDMIEDLIYISKMDSDMQVLNKEKYDLREVLSECISRKKIIADDRNVEIVCDFSVDSVEFECDWKEISKSFLNIIGNCIRYAKSRVDVSCKKDKDGSIEIIIQDDGNGINIEEKDKIFDRFYKGDGGNHGIGLYIALAVIEAHGGSIEADNRSDSKGAIFSIKF